MKKLFYILFLLGGLSTISQDASAQISMDRQAIASGYHTGEVDAMETFLAKSMVSAKCLPQLLGMKTSSKVFSRWHSVNALVTSLLTTLLVLMTSSRS